MSNQAFDLIRAKLGEPFHPSDIKWKPQAVTKDGTKAMAIAYADMRAYMDRLDAVCGADWSVGYTPWGDKIVCHLTILGVTRSSSGEPDSQSERSEIDGTAAEAQAFKRAGAMFGLGRYLYKLPSAWVEYDSQAKGFTAQAKAKLDGIITQHYRRVLGEADKTQRVQVTSPADIDRALDEAAQGEVSQNGPHVQEDMSYQVALKMYEELGLASYGPGWAKKSLEAAKWASGDRTTDAKALTLAELNKANAVLRKAQAKQPA